MTIEQVICDEFQRLSPGRVVKARDDSLRRLVECRAGRQKLRFVALDLQDCGAFGDIADDWTGVVVAARLLPGGEGDLSDIYSGYAAMSYGCAQKFSANDRLMTHAD